MYENRPSTSSKHRKLIIDDKSQLDFNIKILHIIESNNEPTLFPATSSLSHVNQFSNKLMQSNKTIYFHKPQTKAKLFASLENKQRNAFSFP